MNRAPTYLGDGLYASFDGYQIRLFTERSSGVTHEVFLDDSTLAAFQKFITKTTTRTSEGE